MEPFKLGPPQVIKDLVNSVQSGECILFLGAGVHFPSDSPHRYPKEKAPLLGRALAQKLARDCGFRGQLPRESPCDLQRVSLCYETTKGLGRQSLVARLAHYLTAGKEPSPALRMLAAMPFKIVITTNYDQLFEQALHDCGKQELRVVYDPTPDVRSPIVPTQLTSERPVVFKIHGDLGLPKSIVVTDEDYIGFVQRMADKETCHPVPRMVRTCIEQWPTLFVGYSLRDYNLRLLFRTLRSGVDEANLHRCYSVDLHPDELILRVWQNKQLVTFFTENLWVFVPWLYKTIFPRTDPAGVSGDAS